MAIDVTSRPITRCRIFSAQLMEQASSTSMFMLEAVPIVTLHPNSDSEEHASPLFIMDRRSVFAWDSSQTE